LVKNAGHWFSHIITRNVRRYLVGPEQRWAFERPPLGWTPLPVERTSLYLHVPFCRHFCPYCPYTKVPYRESLVEPYTRAAIAEVDWWADAVGPTEVTSIYIGGGTPTLALNSVARVLTHVRERFRLTGDICIETNPADVDDETVERLHDMDVALVSLGVESFQPENLAILGRDYKPVVAERALALLAESGFASVNADIMFALPRQTAVDVTADLARAAQLGADQLTTYPLFTFPYTSVGEYLRLAAVRMPNLRMRRAHYRAISMWCAEHGFERVSVWGFKRGTVPRYSSVTRDGYIGIGPGAGSHLSDGFVLNTFNLNSWIHATRGKCTTVALRMPFAGEMSGWWWLYWRFYDTSIPLDDLDMALGSDASKARRWLRAIEQAGLAVRNSKYLELTEAGAFWIHLAQNYFALNYVNTLWTQARQEPWPQAVTI
jgi:coproporphyrinogen III oxidase-like Fe-S oxidoreductase